ncbi:hypothetical protein E4K10_22325 [Streptomyces sp. T1317-0309]|nr:hypothetical protein E4K10_22325 [Streptomyces sp. T1317-0309]
MTTRQVTAPVVEELGLHTTPEELASRITARAPLNTVLIDITVRDTRALRAARIANAVADRFTSVVERLETPKRLSGSGKSSRSRTSPVSLGVTQEAVAPTAPVSPRPVLNLAAGVLAGLLLGAGLVALRGDARHTLKTGEMLTSSPRCPSSAPSPTTATHPRSRSSPPTALQACRGLPQAAHQPSVLAGRRPAPAHRGDEFGAR